MANRHVRVSSNPETTADACTRYVLQCLEETLKSKPFATMALSGGSSPKLLFEKLAKADFDWTRVHFFFVDERCVLPTDDQSNFKLANDHLFVPAEVKHANVHRVLGELTPEEAAIRYIEDIKNFFALEQGQLPEFDIIHRGMGPDAHTASLFPGEPLIENRTGIAAAVWVEKMNSHRVTLLPGVLLKSSQTILQVVGTDKAEALHGVLNNPIDLTKYPCQIATRDSDKATWFVDEAANSRL